MLSITNILFGSHSAHVATTPSLLIQKWLTESPVQEREHCNQIASAISSACKKEALTLDYCILGKTKTLPPIPEGVRTLQIECKYIHRLFCPLPDSVEKLSLSNLSPNVINNFPDNLTSLSLEKCDLSFIPFFPTSLTELKLNNCTGVINSAELPNLKQLHIDGGEVFLIPEQCKSVDSSIIYDSFPESISKLNPSLADNIVFPENLSTLSLCFIEWLSTIPKLPDNLKHLTLLSLGSAKSFDYALPERMESLEIRYCDSLNVPTLLPSTLSKITIHADTPIKWNISPENLPLGVDLDLYNIKIDQDCYKRPDILFFGVSAESALTFKSGDIVFGINSERRNIVNTIIQINCKENSHDIMEKSKKNIYIQNTLTDAIWNIQSPHHFNDDATINNTLHDGERGIAFKNFLKDNPRYNVTSELLSNLSDKQRWIKTSKAGLDFQTKVRGGNVIFCVDLLVESIPEIATKERQQGDLITAHELRWLYRHRDENYVKQNVKFSLKGKIVSHDTVFLLSGWELYQPKRHARKQAGDLITSLSH